jgi:hypothetical protein
MLEKFNNLSQLKILVMNMPCQVNITASSGLAMKAANCALPISYDLYFYVSVNKITADWYNLHVYNTIL